MNQNADEKQQRVVDYGHLYLFCIEGTIPIEFMLGGSCHQTFETGQPSEVSQASLRELSSIR